MDHILDQVGCFQKHSRETASNKCALKHPRDIVLEQIYQSLEGEDDLGRCIQEAIVFHPGIDSRSDVKVLLIFSFLEPVLLIACMLYVVISY